MISNGTQTGGIAALDRMAEVPANSSRLLALIEGCAGQSAQKLKKPLPSCCSKMEGALL